MLDAREWLDVFPALENVHRFNILIFLYNDGPHYYSEIMREMRLTPGSVTHHLNKLLDTGLISNSYITPEAGERNFSRYEITERGKEILRRLLEP